MKAPSDLLLNPAFTHLSLSLSLRHRHHPPPPPSCTKCNHCTASVVRDTYSLPPAPPLCLSSSLVCQCSLSLPQTHPPTPPLVPKATRGLVTRASPPPPPHCTSCFATPSPLKSVIELITRTPISHLLLTPKRPQLDFIIRILLNENINKVKEIISTKGCFLLNLDFLEGGCWLDHTVPPIRLTHLVGILIFVSY